MIGFPPRMIRNKAKSENLGIFQIFFFLRKVVANREVRPNFQVSQDWEVWPTRQVRAIQEVRAIRPNSGDHAVGISPPQSEQGAEKAVEYRIGKSR